MGDVKFVEKVFGENYVVSVKVRKNNGWKLILVSFLEDI